MSITRIPLSIPRATLELYRGDDALIRILLAAPAVDTDGDASSITATSGSASVTVSDSTILAVGYRLYTASDVLIGTVATVGSGTATLAANATATYTGAYKVGIDWETAVTNATLDLVRFGTGTAVLSLALGDGITLDGDWCELDFTDTDTQVPAQQYAGDFRVELADGSITTLIRFDKITIYQNRSAQP